ncbi:hypothetical protein JDW15_01380 [Aerococcaceae bacterium zg-ZJ1578]|uniref:hypothetical protein n=1 Tax=Aerococcaceae bacterium zg-252 TaxID=2796928 RepID=UPI001A2683AD|nr:hypothetical protein [Aerococcaceae bacterium zg-1578]
MSKSLKGQIHSVRFPYFDIRNNKTSFKARPMLIIGVEKDQLPCDIIALPISKISIAKNIHDDFDIKLESNQIQALNLNHDPSYIRVHKQLYVPSQDVQKTPVSNLKEIFPELYKKIQEKSHMFHETLF